MYKMFRFIKKWFFIGSLFLSSYQAYKLRPEIININGNESVFYTFSNKTSKCSGSCNNINNPYAKICVPDVVKDLNVEVFNLMSRTNETRHIKWHETCKCKLRLDANVCNASICETGEYLGYEISKCREKLFDKLTEECIENIDEVKIASANKHKDKCSCCTLYIVLFSILFTINIAVATYFVYYKYMNRDKESASRYDYVYQTKKFN